MIASQFRSAILVAAVLLTVTLVAVIRDRAPTSSSADNNNAGTTQPATLPRMIDLGADKCIPCKKMAPILAELKAEYAGRAKIEFIDVWKNPAAGEPYGVRIIPTQIFFNRAGKERWRHEGFLSKKEIVAKLKELGVS